MKLIDLTGQKFNRLTVVSLHSKGSKGGTKWNCLCDCGETDIVDAQNLKNGHVKSCGCYKTEMAGRHVTTHGLCKQNKRLYKIWIGINFRCSTPKGKGYKHYGSRGITVCEQWKNDCKTFFQWALSNGYKPDLTIDRIDNNGNYMPENCTWITAKENSQKTAKFMGMAKVIEIRNELKNNVTVKELAKKYSVHPRSVYRIRKQFNTEVENKQPAV